MPDQSADALDGDLILSGAGSFATLSDFDAPQAAIVLNADGDVTVAHGDAALSLNGDTNTVGLAHPG